MKTTLLAILTSLLLFSCWEKDKYLTGTFPSEVVNFEEVNSAADDYNSDLPVIGGEYLFQFSSNRGTGEFNITGKELWVTWNTESGRLQIYTNNYDITSNQVLLDSINRPLCNELGPYSFSYGSGSSPAYTMLYASDCNGDYDIWYRFFRPPGNSKFPTGVSDEYSLGFINTPANELYPTFYGWNYLHNYASPTLQEVERLLHCSDAGGNFDIYEVPITGGDRLFEQLSASTGPSPSLLPINSPASDKCPFVLGRMLVFASDRAGGFGGYDLYYSLAENDSWTEPINFGEGINTEYDEYRPIAVSYQSFTNLLLLFSSNRPGGQGGFDLYYAGVDKVAE
jgi:hypothetical protein